MSYTKTSMAEEKDIKIIHRLKDIEKGTENCIKKKNIWVLDS